MFYTIEVISKTQTKNLCPTKFRRNEDARRLSSPLMLPRAVCRVGLALNMCVVIFNRDDVLTPVPDRPFTEVKQQFISDYLWLFFHLADDRPCVRVLSFHLPPQPRRARLSFSSTPGHDGTRRSGRNTPRLPSHQDLLADPDVRNDNTFKYTDVS